MSPDRQSPAALPSQTAHAALNITKRCNQGCVFCFEGDRRSWEEPSFSQVQALLRAAARRSSRVIFMGAEALLRRDIVAVIRDARSLGLEVAAFTNGQAFAREGFVEELAEAGLAMCQVSAHYADADSFAEGTRTPPRRFESFLSGLENVARHNRRRPGQRLEIFPKTVLMRYNYLKLEAIKGLLSRALGPSFRRYMIGGLSPARARAAVGLLEPFAGRREELASFLRGWPRDLELDFSLLPLCLIPGWEHRCYSVQDLSEGVRIDSNFDDKSRLGPMHRHLDQFKASPYRWLCRDCRLLALCPFVRTSWHYAGFHPAREQEPLPVTAYGAREVLARVEHGLGASARKRRRERVQAQQRRCRKVPVPESALHAALTRLDGPSLRVEAIYCEGEPIFCVELRFRGTPMKIRLSHPRPGRELGFLLGGLELRFERPPDAAPALLKAALRAIAAAKLPRAERWRGFPFFDARLAALASTACALLGEKAWPGLSRIAGWTVLRARGVEAGGLALEFSAPGGALARLTLDEPAGLAPPEEGVAPLLATPSCVVRLDLRQAGEDGAARARLARELGRIVRRAGTGLAPAARAGAARRAVGSLVELQSYLSRRLAPAGGGGPFFAGYRADSVSLGPAPAGLVVWLARAARGSRQVEDAFALRVTKPRATAAFAGLRARPCEPGAANSPGRKAALLRFLRWLRAG